MAELDFTAAPVFISGTVGAYAKRLWAGPPPEPGDAPRAPLAGTASIDTRGFAEFTGLEYDTAYYVGAQVAGTWLWKSARTPAAPLGGAGGVSEHQAVTLGAGLVASTVPAQIRSEDALTTARLEGNAKATTTIAAGATIMKVPASFCPKRIIEFWGEVNGSSAVMRVSTLGVVTCVSAIASGFVVTIPEGVTWSIADSAGSGEGGGGGGGGGGGLDEGDVRALVAEGPYADSVLEGVPVDLGNTLNGNITLDLSLGTVFHGGLSADADLHAIANAVAAVVEECAVRIKTNGHKLTASMVDEWLQGVEPPQEATAALSFSTEDGAVTIFGYGTPELPDDVVRASAGGTPPAGQFVATDGAGGFVITAAPGVDPAAVLKLIEEAALLSGGHKVTATNAPLGEGELLVSVDPEHAQWEAASVVVLPYALARWAFATITGAAGELQADTITRVTKNNAVVEMWHSGIRVAGMQIGVRVPVGNNVKVKGPFTEGSETETEQTLAGRATTYVFVLNAEKVWVPVS